ncbi:MAG: STAS/SEC14 domain-containing protein [Bacteroidetes bacterium]|nr:STAS/SEC14 domain-containing protein [Bacteroidota bacterium]
MYKQLPDASDDVLAFQVSGTLSKEDYQAILPMLTHVIDKHGSVNLLVKAESLTGVEPSAVWEEIKFDAKHLSDIARFAFVGDAAWIGGAVMLCKPFVGDARHFKASETEEAFHWVEGAASAA